MMKNIRLLLTVCLLAITGLIVLQFFWIKNYHKTALSNFEREVNLVFEDAIKKDFQLRCDTIERLLTEQLMDTTAFTIRSRHLAGIDGMVHIISSVKDKQDYSTFSQPALPDSLTAGDTAYKRKIAHGYARNIRTKDLENHVVFYNIRSLGHFTLDKVKEYGFDTSRFRPVLQQTLELKDIHTSFHFYTAHADSLSNYSTLPDSLTRTGIIVTKAQPTYKWWAYNEQYTRVVFENPLSFVFKKMKWILAGSFLLVVLVGLTIWLLLKALFHEKKLAVIKNDFINNITHELKTPVATISAAVEALEDGDISKEKHSRYLGHARNEANRLGKLIDNILNISLYGKNTLRTMPEQIETQETISEIADKLRISTDKPVHFQFINNTGIPTVKADRSLFQQALTNILDNAIKYSGSKAEIIITCDGDNRYFHICCADKGEGIAASSMPYVFEKFYREPRPNHAVKGYGLGLNYVQEIMNAHNGKIGINSIKGRGTTVILSWPL